MHVREADTEDIEIVCRMRLEFVADHRGVLIADLPKGFVEQTRSFVERGQRTGSIRSWLAQDHGGFIGVVSMVLFDVPPLPEDPRTRQGYIIDMYVGAARRREGVGRALFAACVASAPNLGVRRLFLRATDAGRPLYLQAGFNPNDEWLELVLPGLEWGVGTAATDATGC